MKRLWIGIGIMAFVVGLLIWGNLTITTACNKMTGEIESIKQYAQEEDDFSGAQLSASRLKDIWTQYHAPLSAIKNHDELHDLIVNINLIQTYTEEEALEDLIDACDDSLVRLEHIKDGEKITFGNVF